MRLINYKEIQNKLSDYNEELESIKINLLKNDKKFKNTLLSQEALVGYFVTYSYYAGKIIAPFFEEKFPFEDNEELPNKLLKKSNTKLFLDFIEKQKIKISEFQVCFEQLDPAKNLPIKKWNLPTYEKGKNLSNLLNIINQFDDLNNLKIPAKDFNTLLKNKIIEVNLKYAYAGILTIQLYKKYNKNLDLDELKRYKEDSLLNKLINKYGLDLTVSVLLELNNEKEKVIKLDKFSVDGLFDKLVEKRLNKFFNIKSIEFLEGENSNYIQIKKEDVVIKENYSINAENGNELIVCDKVDSNKKLIDMINSKYKEISNKDMNKDNFNLLLLNTMVKQKDIIDLLSNKVKPTYKKKLS